MDGLFRVPVITANWKMYKTVEEGRSFVRALAPLIDETSAKVWIAVPFTSIYPIAQDVIQEDLGIVVGAQNIYDEEEGPYTGEISGRMVREAGAQFVIVGHSERRRLFHETNQCIRRKIEQALSCGLIPVLCIGETLDQHQQGKVFDVVEMQLRECLKDFSEERLKDLVIAYEPTWAIGNTQSATPEFVQKIHAQCRSVLTSLFSSKFAKERILQYGGSVTPSNATDLLDQPDVDGLLIGGASLFLESFSQIINDSMHNGTQKLDREHQR